MNVPLIWQLAPPGQAIHERKQGGSLRAFHVPILGITHRHIGHILFVRSKSLGTPTLKGRGSTFKGRLSKNLGCVLKPPQSCTAVPHLVGVLPSTPWLIKALLFSHPSVILSPTCCCTLPLPGLEHCPFCPQISLVSVLISQSWM